MGYPILYVDDDEANLTVFQVACGAEFEVLTALSGAQALAILHEREVAVLLTDQRMPKMSGTELAEIVRLKHPDTLRYLITAYSDLSAAIEAINRGNVSRYLRKPWDNNELRASLREGLELYQARRRLRELETRMLEVERVYALGVVSASIAHELRNPMSIVNGNLDLALMSYESQSPTDLIGARTQLDKLKELVSAARRACVRVTEIMRGIELSTRRRDQQQACDVADVVRLTLQMVQGKLRHRATIEVATPESLIVTVNETKLSQVVLNLLVNAMEALPDNRSEGENHIRLSVTQQDDVARLEVADNGPGIAQDVLARVFDPFFTTKANGGTGLGLAISKQIVEDVGGRMLVDSSPGRGACFTVELPRAGVELARVRAAAE
jgi:signal transduction histidine kinase